MADTISKTSESYVTTRERPMHAPRLHAGVNTPQSEKVKNNFLEKSSNLGYTDTLMDETVNCVIYDKSLSGEGDVVTLKEKGSEGINRASTERFDSITTVPGQQVHQNCRREYCRPSSIKRAKRSVSEETTNSRRSFTRKAEQCFSFKTDCFFCGTKVEFGLNSKRKRLGEAFSVTTIETKDTTLKICSERNDAWSEAIRARLMNVHDLPAADAIYHQTCNVNFRTNRQLPQLYETD